MHDAVPMAMIDRLDHLSEHDEHVLLRVVTLHDLPNHVEKLALRHQLHHDGIVLLVLGPVHPAELDDVGVAAKLAQEPEREERKRVCATKKKQSPALWKHERVTQP